MHNRELLKATAKWFVLSRFVVFDVPLSSLHACLTLFFPLYFICPRLPRQILFTAHVNKLRAFAFILVDKSNQRE